MTLRRIVREMMQNGAIDLTKLDSSVLDLLLTADEKDAVESPSRGDNPTLSNFIITKVYGDANYGLGSGTDFEIQILTITSIGQTVITLLTIPVDPLKVLLNLNGITQKEGTDYSVLGSTLTWNDPSGLILEPSDRLIAIYEI